MNNDLLWLIMTVHDINEKMTTYYWKPLNNDKLNKNKKRVLMILLKKWQLMLNTAKKL